MITFYKNTTPTIYRYLKPTITSPHYGIFLTNKLTKVVVYFSITDTSTVDTYQKFDFTNISQQLDYGTYNYEIIESNTSDNPPTNYNKIEIGLLQILGVGTCDEPDISYDEVDDTIVYYDCNN